MVYITNTNIHKMTVLLCRVKVDVVNVIHKWDQGGVYPLPKNYLYY